MTHLRLWQIEQAERAAAQIAVQRAAVSRLSYELTRATERLAEMECEFAREHGGGLEDYVRQWEQEASDDAAE
jgi:hypothetical protein